MFLGCFADSFSPNQHQALTKSPLTLSNAIKPTTPRKPADVYRIDWLENKKKRKMKVAVLLI